MRKSTKGGAVLSAVAAPRARRRASPPEGGAPVSSPSVRIVLLEDMEADAELILETLLGTGLDFTAVTVDSREGFEAALSHRLPNIILSDYYLPNFEGDAALQIAKQMAPDVPFIFVTGILGEEVVIAMLTEGATDYVLKSRLSRLGPAVTRALREAEQRRENLNGQVKLRRSLDQLRALTGHLRFVREEERTRIAREVHDELGQALTSLKLDLSWVYGKISGERALRRKIKAMSDHVDATIHTVRRIATDLRPGVLDTLGLAAAIEWQTADFQMRTGITCEVKIDLKETIMDRELSTMCFRIFQETLTNIMRHAKATLVEVSLARVETELVLTVRDNGRGITEEQVVHAKSLGLIGMRERVAQLGGQVFFFGLPNRGTTVTMRVPMPDAPVHEFGPS